MGFRQHITSIQKTMLNHIYYNSMARIWVLNSGACSPNLSLIENERTVELLESCIRQ